MIQLKLINTVFPGIQQGCEKQLGTAAVLQGQQMKVPLAFIINYVNNLKINKFKLFLYEFF